MASRISEILREHAAESPAVNISANLLVAIADEIDELRTENTALRTGWPTASGLGNVYYNPPGWWVENGQNRPLGPLPTRDEAINAATGINR